MDLYGPIWTYGSSPAPRDSLVSDPDRFRPIYHESRSIFNDLGLFSTIWGVSERLIAVTAV